MKSKIIILILIITASSAYSQESLERYLKEAADSNSSLRAKFLEYMAAAEKAEGASSLPDPNLTFGWFVSPVETRVGSQQMKISLSQRFPWFGKLQSREDHLAALAQVRYQEFEDYKQELYLNIIISWYNLLETRHEIVNLKKRINIITTRINSLESSYTSGEYAYDTLVELINERTVMKNYKNDLENKYYSQKASFNKLLNKSPESDVTTEFNIPDAQLTAGYEELIDSVLTQNSRLAIYESKRYAAEKALKTAQNESFPDVTLAFDYIFIKERDDAVPDNGKDAAMPMLSLNIPVFRGKYNAQTEEAQSLIKSTDESIASEKYYIRSLLMSYASDFEAAKINVELFEDIINKTQSRIDAGISSFESGSSIDKILKLKEIKLKYELRLFKSKISRNLSVFRIERLMSNYEYNK
ncbi:MAG: TolC family protein [Candidatus Kapaibacterium sp.]